MFGRFFFVSSVWKVFERIFLTFLGKFGETVWKEKLAKT